MLQQSLSKMGIDGFFFCTFRAITIDKHSNVKVLIFFNSNSIEQSTWKIIHYFLIEREFNFECEIRNNYDISRAVNVYNF